MYMQEYTALYTSPSNNNSTGKPELTPIEEGGLANVKARLGLVALLGVSARVGGIHMYSVTYVSNLGLFLVSLLVKDCSSFNPSSEYTTHWPPPFLVIFSHHNQHNTVIIIYYIILHYGRYVVFIYDDLI